MNTLVKTALIAVLAVLAAVPLTAQRPDSSRSASVPIVPDSLVNPPISPRRAFLYSFLAPGYSQARLGRNKAAAAFVLVEAISISMIRESAADAHEARRFADDSMVIEYSAAGTPAYAPPRFTSKEVRTRDAHVEDWAALLIANHLFAGADAFVAAHLWDVGVKLGLRRTPNGTALTAAFRR